MKIQKKFAWLLVTVSVWSASGAMVLAAQSNAQAVQKLSMEQIMAHPDWMGIAPERAYFSRDAKSVYFSRKAVGSELRDLYQVSVQGGVVRKLSLEESVKAENEQGFWSVDRSRYVWLRQGNLWLMRDGKTRQLSRTGDMNGLLGFVGNEHIALRQDGKVLLIHAQSGEQSVLMHLKNEDDPQQKKESNDYLNTQQSRLFDIIAQRDRNKKAMEQRQKEMASLAATMPIYLGKGREFQTFSLAPDGAYALVGVVAPRKDGRTDKMPHYVSADGYVKVDDVRSKVGTGSASDEQLYVIDIRANKAVQLKLDQLPGVNEDPLLALKTAAAQKLGKPAPKASVPRALYAGRGARWTSGKLALNLFSSDNKDRWTISVDLSALEKNPWQLEHRLTDAAWVNDGSFNELGWTQDGKALWYLSEESGYSHLYLKSRELAAMPLTQGRFEVSDVRASRDGKWFYYRANKKHPGIYEVYRVSKDGKRDEALTDLNGGLDYDLSPNEDQLLLTHSTTTRQPDLWVQAAAPGAKPVRLTDSTSKEFAQIDWIKPEVIAIPSKHGAAPIYSRVYRSRATQTGAPKPAVMFVHGAGYLQAAHHGWSNYFREMMFHNLLVQEGYVVIDMDYRASAGYGRDWRTAIYQRMGTPELEDYEDGLDWLVEHANVDKNRVGIYGGSYGGFMAFMAMFKTEKFAAGAALRPVADWAHYNHGYTSNILNTPDVDPDAYARSSPIEFAAGLKRPLLICSGILDDNVFFQDSVRMVQKLIELKNPNFELAVYPIEPHGFREPTSWLDEYRRIFKLMENEVKGRR